MAYAYDCVTRSATGYYSLLDFSCQLVYGYNHGVFIFIFYFTILIFTRAPRRSLSLLPDLVDDIWAPVRFVTPDASPIECKHLYRTRFGRETGVRGQKKTYVRDVLQCLNAFSARIRTVKLKTCLVR